MEKIHFNCACEIKEPIYESSSDSIQTTSLMRVYGKPIGNTLLQKAFAEIVKEFQRNPSEVKIFQFTLTCEEINAD